MFFKVGYGEPVLLQNNAKWPHPDGDYTPNMNYIAAVWPTLRYNSYTVAVIIARNMDVTSYYLPSTTLSLPDPCSHPNAIKCDTTGQTLCLFLFHLKENTESKMK